ncbi:MAG TPA: hypothetical protein VKA84_26650 [Gemmatimonadaceae bacterium]|nr:hypothetical protein [Gemmatimonadaceae bacterium]
MSRSDLVQRYTETDLQNARTKGQIVGWVQGGVAAFALLLVVGLIGWIPSILLLAVVAAVVYKLLKR